MHDTKTISAFELARLHYQHGNFQLALNEITPYLEEVNNLIEWIDLARLTFQCALELDQLEKFEPVYKNVIFLKSSRNKDQKELSRLEYLFGIWCLAKNDRVQAQFNFDQALSNSMAINDHPTTARILHAIAAVHAIKGDFQLSLDYIDKSLTITENLTLTEIEVNCLILKGYILTQNQSSLEKGLELTWLAYEKAKKNSFQHLIANIFFQLAIIYKNIGDENFSEIFYSLATKGISEEKYPRLHRLIKQNYTSSEKNKSIEYDFLIEEERQKICIRDKGFVEFKNQHILFDIVKLLSLNPGQRFSKEDLIHQVWNSSYNSHIHDNLIYVSIKRLRTIIEPNPELPRFILRDRQGYFLPSSIKIKFQNAEAV